MYNLKKILTVLLAISLALPLCARERRFLCEKLFDAIPDKETVFRPGTDWAPFPAYEDREAWDKLSQGYKAQIIKRGEAALNYEWKLIKASEFLQCKVDGDREHLRLDRELKGNIANLAIAEAVEGKGRFIPHLIDGILYEAERTTWQYAVHTDKQPSRRPLADPEDRYITNGAAATGGIMATAWYLLHNEFDKIDPVISRTILNAIDKNILEPFLDESKESAGSHFWMGKDWEEKDGQIANWTTHCTTNCMYCFLLCEQNPERRLAGIRKGLRLIDNYLDSMPLDGSCDEGPSYWGMGPATMFSFAVLMRDASYGKLDLLKDDQVRRMCEYKSKIYIADGWEVNFADGEPRSGCSPVLPFRMGTELGSEEMKDFSLFLLSKDRKKFSNPVPSLGGGLGSLYAMKNYPELKAAEDAALEQAGGDFELMKSSFRKNVSSEWYKDNQVALLRGNDGWFIGAKGGTNGERHNHNDVGSAILFYGNFPIAVDMGCSTYRKETFGKMRYTLLENISAGHNIVTINGCDQGTGKQFKASGTKCDLQGNKFSTDVAGAYPEEAHCKSWVRSYEFIDGGGIVIRDSYELTERVAEDDIHFVTNGTATIKGHEVHIICRSYKNKENVSMRMTVPKGLKAEVIPIENLDKRHVKNFGPEMCRIVLRSSKKAPLKGEYEIKITKI